MFILAIETTGSYGSVALLDEKGNILGYEVSHETMSHLKDLIPMADAMLKKCGVSKDEIDLLAPSIGPGSFTGIRIGVSTARALCQALGIKAVPVPTLEAFLLKETAEGAQLAGKSAAYRAAGGQTESGRTAGGQTENGRTAVCAIINARRGQVYGMIDGFMEPGPYMLADVLGVYKEKIKPYGGKILFFGDGIDAYEKDIKEALGEPGQGPESCFEFAPKEDRYQDAVSVGRWAAKRVREWRAEAAGAADAVDAAGAALGCAVDFEQLLPDYMRRAEAEQKLESGELPICKGPKQE